MARNCGECGKNIDYRHPNAKFCEKCAKERKLDIQREYRKRPEVREKIRIRAREYSKRPHVREHGRIQAVPAVLRIPLVRRKRPETRNAGSVPVFRDPIRTTTSIAVASAPAV